VSLTASFRAFFSIVQVTSHQLPLLLSDGKSRLFIGFSHIEKFMWLKPVQHNASNPDLKVGAIG
jgi:hypothetical protein